MTTLKDGAAAGVVLMLKRAPELLRVVRAKDGTWDALDQLIDVPDPDEEIYVYRRHGEVGGVHICRSPRSQSGWFTMAEYRAVTIQPEDAVLRDTARWREWAATELLTS